MSPPRPRRYTIVAVDPGTRNVGVAALAIGRRLTPAVLHHGTIRTTASAPIFRRLGEIADGLDELLDRIRPDVLVVEDVFHGKNVRSALKIGEARGVVLLAAARRGIDLVEYPPAVVKRTVCGHGGASKARIQSMIARLLPLAEPPDSADAADALAIGFCHAQRIRSGIPHVPASRRHARRREARSLQALVDRVEEGRRRGKRR